METVNTITFRTKILTSSKMADFFNYLINDEQENCHKEINNILHELLLEENSNSDLKNIITENSIFHKLFNSADTEEKKIILTNFILSFFSNLIGNNHIIQKILSKPKILKEINEIVTNFENLKTKKFLILTPELQSSALEIIFDKILNFRFWKSFVEIFELKNLIFSKSSDFETFYIIDFINNLIDKSIAEKNTHLDHLMRLIEFTYENSLKENPPLLDQINSNPLLNYLLSEKSFFTFLKKLLKFFPKNSEQVVSYFLQQNDVKSATLIVKEFDSNNVKIREEIIFKSQCKSIKYHFIRYKNYEIEFQQLVELADKNISIISYLIELCCRENLIVESYHLLRLYDFNTQVVKVEEISLMKIQEYLISLYPGDYTRYTVGKNSKFSYAYSQLNPRRVDTNFLKTFSNDINMQITFEDYFGPYEYTSYKLPLREDDIMIVDSLDKLNAVAKLVTKKSNLNFPYVGFDAEWKSPSCVLDNDNGASILQLAIKDKVFIFDCLKLNTLQEEELKYFGKLLNDIFKDKTLIGFSHKQDFDSIKNPVIKKSLTELKSIDFTHVYEKKFNIKCPNLKKVCKEILNKDLCKFEQISNWENRPLRMRQLHYAALDAYVLLKLYENI